MINLLGHENHKQLRASRINVILRYYLLFLGFIALFIASAYGVGYYLLMQDEQSSIAISDEFAVERATYADDLAAATEFNQNLASAKLILANETLFSDLIITIAQTLPPETVLNTLNLTTNNLTTPIVLDFSTTSYDRAIAIKDAFEASPAFDDVNIIRVAQIPTEGSPYSTQVSLNVTVAAKSSLAGGAQ